MAKSSLISIGIDLVKVAEFVRRPPNTHSAFYSLVFTENELRRIHGVECGLSSAERLALCFSVKEAAIKALGTFGDRRRWTVPQIETQDDDLVRITSRRGERIPRLLGYKLQVVQSKLSRDKAVAIAFVALFQEDGQHEFDNYAN